MKDLAVIIAVAALLVCGWVGKPASLFDAASAKETVNVQNR